MSWLQVVKDSYQIAVGAWGIQPVSFWDMDPEEWWWIHEMKSPRDKSTHFAGRLSEDDVKELYEMLH